MHEDNQSACGHTDEEHEFIARVRFYTNPDENNDTSEEQDRKLMEEATEVFGERDATAEIMIAARHCHDYHPVIDPDSILAMKGGVDLLWFLKERAEGHAEAMMDQVETQGIEVPPESKDLLTAFAIATMYDGVMLGSYMNGHCPQEREHSQFSEAVSDLEDLLKNNT